MNFKDDTPKIEGHEELYTHIVKDYPYQQWPFANILSAITCYIFYQKLHLLDLISAHHIIIPILTAVFLYILFRFVKRYWGSFAGLVSVLTLITYPRFFGHSFNNIKDVPLIIFSSIAIMHFTEWFLKHKIRYLYYGFIFLGFALAIRADAILVLVI